MAFTLNVADLSFVLKQIKISEAHANGAALTEVRLDLSGNVITEGSQYDPVTGAFLGDPALPRAVPDPHVPNGLRTVDGRFNNLVDGREEWGAADTPMPRLFDPNFQNDADGDTFDANGPAPGGVVTNNNYGVGGNVADADPRIISNLVADMSVNNPAAITAWLNNPLAVAAWQEANPGKNPVAPGQIIGPDDVELTNADLALIPFIAPDEGLSKPFNAWMTFFGQFFDHGLDLISKGGNGTIFVPLQTDDPLYVPGGHTNFMVLTRATPVEGSQNNVTTSFVDQNQTYTSHASHQVFLREYAMVDGRPVATGRLLEGQSGGLTTWADVKAQARDMLGIEMSDADVSNVPLLRTDPYGEFIRDAEGFPLVIVGIGADMIPNTDDDVVVSGTPTSPVILANLNGGLGPVRTNHAFLDDIAHNAVPVFAGGVLAPDSDPDTGNAVAVNPLTGRNLEYDDELLDRHFITGDGRGNENIGLTAVHHVFHSEHNRQVDTQKLTILQSGDLAFINEWLVDDLASLPVLPAAPLAQLAFADTLSWDGERLFQAARFATEMQYQHLVFEEFARVIQPNIDPFVFANATDVNPAIFSEFANTVYRFGHSMLTDNMPRIDVSGNSVTPDLDLIGAFLNPVLYDANGGVSPETAAGNIVRGMVVEHGNEIDEFVVNALRNNLLGLPLDLAAINIARGRDTGIPTLNDARGQLYAASGSTFLKPYDHWVDFAANLKNPASAVNFIAAYGTHTSITTATTLEAKRDAAMLLVFGDIDVNGDSIVETAPTDRVDFVTGTNTWAGLETGINLIDLWIGGLAEKKMPFGGFLGSTFNAVFELQLENLQDGDRLYYLSRTQGQNFLTELENNSFAKMIMANTDIAAPGADGIRGTPDDVITRHIGVDVFSKYDFTLEMIAANQEDYNGAAAGRDPVGNDPILEALGLGKVARDDIGTAAPDVNYIRFTGGEHVAVGGTIGNDTIITDFGDDGIWGDAGDDRIESGAGVDLVNGGSGDDIITDSGDTGDFLKGDEGNDVISGGNGLDVLMGGSGKDTIFVGVDSTEVFGGEGDDFIRGGLDFDVLIGGEGNDWMEGGGGTDELAGDNNDAFFNSKLIGHDVMFAGFEAVEFHAESGDDIMVQGESVMRNEGMFGFDWAIFKGVQINGNADLRIPIFTTEEEDALRNRFNQTEGLSGWNFNDTLIGDDRLPGLDPLTPSGVNGLDQAGIDRIANLDEIVSLAPAQQFFEGNILLGGAGSDLLQGNVGEDIIDGDRWLNVRISIRDASDAEIATVDSLKHVFVPIDGVDPSWIGKSLFELLVARTVSSSQLHIVREVLSDSNAGDVDVAVFRDIRANYTVTLNPDGSRTVQQNAVSDVIDPDTGVALLSDDVDTVRNVEILRFADVDEVIGAIPNPANVAATGTPVISDTSPTKSTKLTAFTSQILDQNGVATATFAYQWQAFIGGVWTNIAGATSQDFTPTDAEVNHPLRVRVTFQDDLGNVEQLFSAATDVVGDHIDGTAGADNLVGTAGADEIEGLPGPDTLTGGLGDDILNGNRGADKAFGGEGNDTIFGEIGNDELHGQEGDDTLSGGDNNDTLRGGSGNDTLSGGINADTLYGDEGNDQLRGDAGTDTLFGGLGNDTLSGGIGIDVLHGEDGDDTLFGDDGDDQLNGGVGNDTLYGGVGNDLLRGEDGNDTLIGNDGADRLRGLAGNDTLIGSRGDDSVFGQDGDDRLIWNAGDGRDVMDGGTGVDTVSINGNVTAETFHIWSRSAALAAGITAIGANTEIVITRNSTANIIAELDNIEEIEIDGKGGGDTFVTHGNFAGTSLSTSTITIDGTSGDDTVDITQLDSAHRIVFRSNGGNDTIVGTLRPQDVVELSPAPNDLTETQANGFTTVSNGVDSVTFSSVGDPTVSPGFALTARDVAGIKNLVNGLQAFSDDDDTEGHEGIRDLEGTGNNIANPDFGSADQVFIRLTNAHYGELNEAGTNRNINPIFQGLDARNISNLIGAQEADLPKNANEANIFFMAFGQYFDHGLDFLPKDSAFGTLPIGGPGSSPTNPADLTRGAVFEIDANGIPQHLNKTSPFVDQNQAYGSTELVGQFLRESDGTRGFGANLLQGATDPSAPDYKLLPTLRELINHHWAADTLFFDPAKMSAPISFRDYYTDFEISPGVTGDLLNNAGAFDPQVLSSLASNFMGSGHALLLDTNPFVSLLDHYVAGDGRTNENFALTSMHTIWARNHNFHVEKLLEAGFQGTFEELFQAAKMINEAEYQRVVFNEFADMLLGGLRGDGSHAHDEYDPHADARISHEFAAAVYRVGHSLIGQTITVLDPNGQPKQVQLFDAFLNPSNDADVFTAPLPPGYVPQPGYEQLGAAAILGGAAMQQAEEVDFNIVDAVRNDLLRIRADLFAFNVTRGWDVGLGTLNQVRMDLQASSSPYIQEAIGFAGALDPYVDWDDFQTRNGLSDEVIAQFMQAYPDLVLSTQEEIDAFQAANPDITLVNGNTVKGIDRVDLWVGGLAEKHILGGMVGQTFWVVLHEQFDRLQQGDRFYYLDRFDNFDFYETFVDGQEFSDIIFRNTGLNGLPEHIFQVAEGITLGQGQGNPDPDPDPDPQGLHLVGTDGPDTLTGGQWADTIEGLAGADKLYGGASGDTIKAGRGMDKAYGGDGGDTMFGDEGYDTLYGEAGDDVLYGGTLADKLYGGEGNDTLNGDGGGDQLYGGAGNDTLNGGNGYDTLYGEAGDDLLNGGLHADKLFGGEGNDTLNGDGGADLLQGDAGDDTLNGGDGTDTLRGGAGNDTLNGGNGRDIVNGNGGADSLSGGLGNDTFRFISAIEADGDTILDFQPGDKVDLSSIDAKDANPGNQTFTLVTGSGFNAAGALQVTHEVRNGEDFTVVEGNTDGGTDAEFKISIKGNHNLTASDFNL